MARIKIDLSTKDPDALRAASTMLTQLAVDAEADPTATPSKSAGEQIIGDLDDNAAPLAAVNDGPAESVVVTAPTTVDLKGVPFNVEFCGKAKDPFYATGRSSGQWKKRQGVHVDAYDKWYADELAKVVSTAPAAQEPVPVNTAEAFNALVVPDPVPLAGAPADCGEFMGWIAKMQAAGKLTPEQIGKAYLESKITVADLFEANIPAVKARIDTLCTILAPIAAAS